ncbi:MAG: cyclic nucleotide-binding domain-containing protein [Rhodospirillaceae bacterium]|jgi:CRP-like cAMP-binding protein|nr:cyclic nucleotide-binding domain-containing protein [Rhodospirillaceae bacterium]MBT3629045.1 cyclic nucleotide-binding domain-containing protein [Rhodospirillaceae bacterium]MBT3927624.1 cyclic nucleotide-binding domain-containing protein [Rhodospirillaceae bacterium]MBT4427816.1 cyclic nucleotide-binding domain-containing protein [Rhodospirillaceae bacterium]MBT5037534.1 cyclic nucleotide-binding domain-containing protein [Rhodospirillaceae bacterium]
MKERQVEIGGVIYREGDPGDAVFILQEGEVEILRQARGEDVRIAVLHQGAIFGEMGVLRDKPRSTTVRALSNTGMIVLSKDEFMTAFGGEDSLALKLIRMLCSRLKKADNKLLDIQHRADQTAITEIGRIHLLANSPTVKTQIGLDGIEISSLPYKIGCHSAADHRASVSATEFLLRSPGNFQIDRRHLGIEDHDGFLVARDLGSHLGSVVNGVRIAEFEPEIEAVLHFGNNDVQLGSIDSPYRFQIIVEPAKGGIPSPFE